MASIKKAKEEAVERNTGKMFPEQPALSMAGRLTMELKMTIPGVTCPMSEKEVKRMEKWEEKRKVFTKAMKSKLGMTTKAEELMEMAGAAFRVQLRSCKRAIGKEGEEKIVEVRVYEVEGLLGQVQLAVEQKANEV